MVTVITPLLSLARNGRDFAGRQVSSGIYFCRLKTGVYTATSRIILLR